MRIDQKVKHDEERLALIEELGTDTDVALAKKYRLSPGRVRELRICYGIASHAALKKGRGPIDDISDKVQSLEDEVMKLHGEIRRNHSTISSLRDKCSELKFSFFSLARSEDRLRQMVIDEVTRAMSTANPRWTRGKPPAKKPTGHAYQEFLEEDK